MKCGAKRATKRDGGGGRLEKQTRGGGTRPPSRWGLPRVDDPGYW
jgi:hypothetical protein